MAKIELLSTKEEAFQAVKKLMEDVADTEKFLVVAWSVKEGVLNDRPSMVLSLMGHVMSEFPLGDIPLAAELMLRHLAVPSATSQPLPAACLEEVLNDD